MATQSSRSRKGARPDPEPAVRAEKAAATSAEPASTIMTGAEMVRALADQGVEHLFGYPGGAVLPIYDALFHQEKVRHILVRHEQGARSMRLRAMRARPARWAACLSPPDPAPPMRSPG